MRSQTVRVPFVIAMISGVLLPFVILIGCKTQKLLDSSNVGLYTSGRLPVFANHMFVLGAFLAAVLILSLSAAAFAPVRGRIRNEPAARAERTGA